MRERENRLGIEVVDEKESGRVFLRDRLKRFPDSAMASLPADTIRPSSSSAFVLTLPHVASNIFTSAESKVARGVFQVISQTSTLPVFHSSL